MTRKKIYYITENQNFTEKEIIQTIASACENGVDIVQVRDKKRPDRQLMKILEEAKRICDAFQVPLVVDDRLDLAMICSCHLHLGQEDIPISSARKILGPKAIIGATTKTVDQAIQAEKEGASYLGVGAIYPTSTKVITRITEIDTLMAICQKVSIPVFAIGGLNHTNLSVLKGLPIEGICVVSAIARAMNISESIQNLKEALLNI